MAIRDMDSRPGFDATLKATPGRHYEPGRAFDIPAMLAFGDHVGVSC